MAGAVIPALDCRQRITIRMHTDRTADASISARQMKLITSYQGYFMFSWKKWRVAAIALVAAFSVVAATDGPAFATDGWHPEIVNGNQQMFAAGTVSEARSGGTLISVWRSNDDQGAIWMSRNNGTAVRLSGQTYDSPTIVPWQDNGFVIFHTGVDNRIYYTTSTDGGSNWSFWNSIPGQTTPYTVSATQLGAGSHELYLTYHSGTDTRTWGTWFDGYNWHGAQDMGGSTYHSPSVTWNPTTHRIYAATTGTDNRVYLSYQDYSTGTWRGWTSVGGTVNGAPSIAASSTGEMVVEVRDFNNQVWDRRFNPWAYPTTDWTRDSTPGSYAGWTPFLVASGVTIFSLMTSLYNHGVFYSNRTTK